MSASLSWINILFRFLNFGVVILAGWYVYRRYIKHSLEETIHDKEILSRGMKELGYMLEGQIHALDDELQSQHERCEQLKEKVLEWQEMVAKQQARASEQRQQLLKEINDRIYEQSARLTYRAQAQKIVPAAMARARKSLQQHFAQSDLQQQFLQDLVRSMRNHGK